MHSLSSENIRTIITLGYLQLTTDHVVTPLEFNYLRENLGFLNDSGDLCCHLNFENGVLDPGFDLLDLVHKLFQKFRDQQQHNPLPLGVQLQKFQQHWFELDNCLHFFLLLCFAGLTNYMLSQLEFNLSFSDLGTLSFLFLDCLEECVSVEFIHVIIFSDDSVAYQVLQTLPWLFLSK